MASRKKKAQPTPFEKARDKFHAAPKARTRTVERVDTCPTCGLPMTLIREYRAPEHYHFQGICSNDPAHNLERFGYYTTEATN